MSNPTFLQPRTNLLYTNSNPDPETICAMCSPFIGMVFRPRDALPLPAHLGCYCIYFPTDRHPDRVNWQTYWATADPDCRQAWIRHTAYLLRQMEPSPSPAAQRRLLPRALQPLFKAAIEYNEQREESSQESPMTNNIVPQKNSPTRTQSGRVLLQPRAVANVSGRREYDCIFMQPGRVKRADQEPSNWLIPADVIKAAAPLFNSVSSYLDHPDLFGFGWHQDAKVRNLAGVTFDAHWSDAEKAMTGCIRLYDEKPDSAGALVGTLMDQMLADQAASLEVPPVGLSAVIFQDHIFDEEAGLRVTTNIAYVESIDFVYDAGAGGYVRAALAALQPRRIWQAATTIGGTEMPEELSAQQPPIPDAVPPASLPVSEPAPPDEALAAINRVSERLEALTTQVAELNPPAPAAAEPEPDPVAAQMEAFRAELDRLTAVTATREEGVTIQGMGQPPRLFGGHIGLDDIKISLGAMIYGVTPREYARLENLTVNRDVRPLTGIRDLYHLMSGDYEMSGVFQEDRVYLANVTASTMAQITANVLNKRVMNLFQEYPRWWEPFVSIEDFATLQDIRWITLGGVGELPTVAAGAAYTELTWDDLAQRDSFTKKGGYLGLTIEAIDKDDTRKLTAAPRALAQSAWLTLSKAISAIFTANSGVGPNIYYDDTNTRALFHASNSNLGSTAFSWAAWDATRTAMRKQTELNSDERLGALVAPKYCLVPSDLEATALQTFASEGEPGTGDNDENPFAEGDAHSARMRAARRRVIVVDLWTNTANWAAVADKKLWSTIGLGFRFGRTPEIFSAADPRAGLMFTNDTLPIKVRYIFATGPVDYRGLYKHNI